MKRTIEEQRKMIEKIYEKVTEKQPRGGHDEMLDEINRILRGKLKATVHVGGSGNAVEVVDVGTGKTQQLTEDDIEPVFGKL